MKNSAYNLKEDELRHLLNPLLLPLLNGLDLEWPLATVRTFRISTL